MSTTIIHKSDTRGHANHGWLDTYHTFSFAGYYDRNRIQFGALRVLNDDRIAAGAGFGLHPHDNMEIITIPLTGELRHEDSMGHTEIILPGEIQVMSAGTGLYHSEFNNSEDEELTLLQIWVLPNKRNVMPRHEQIPVNAFLQPNTFRQIVSPSPDDDGAWIHQEAWFHLGIFDAGAERKHALRKQGNGLYAFIIEGEAVIDGEALGRRDGLGLTNAAEVSIAATSPDTKILLMEVPLMD